MSAPSVIQLRELLSEKFPGLRMQLTEPATLERGWATGLRQVDEPLSGGLPHSALTEIVASGNNSGSTSLMRALLSRAAAQNQIVALVDGRDSLDVTNLPEAALARLLWIRCHAVDEAMKAADLILRDNNLPLVLIDLVGGAAAQLRKIPPTTWYRFQRLLEETTTVCAVFTPRPMIAAAQTRITLRSNFSLAALDAEPDEWLRGLKVEASDARGFSEFAAQNVAG
jgi:hypothetical protein